MRVYPALFTQSDGGGLDPLGVFCDFDQARSAVNDYAAWRVEQAAQSPSLVPATTEPLSWRHYGANPQQKRYHELWVARDGWLNYYLVWRVELGVLAWRGMTVAERAAAGSLAAFTPPWTAPDAPAAEDTVDAEV